MVNKVYFKKKEIFKVELTIWYLLFENLLLYKIKIEIIIVLIELKMFSHNGV